MKTDGRIHKSIITGKNFIAKVLTKVLIFFIDIYSHLISPLFPNSCRYTPSCSSYMRQALQIWGPLQGLWMGTKRIARCNPWGGSGYDPVPEKENLHKPEESSHKPGSL